MGTLTDAQLVDARRYCGFPVYGGQPVQAFGYRFFQWYGTLEFRMNNLDPAETTVVTNMLTTLNTLESAIPGTGSNLDTESAGPWVHNKNELRDREALYLSWRLKLCAFFGVPPGPYLQTGFRVVV